MGRDEREVRRHLRPGRGPLPEPLLKRCGEMNHGVARGGVARRGTQPARTSGRGMIRRRERVKRSPFFRLNLRPIRRTGSPGRARAEGGRWRCRWKLRPSALQIRTRCRRMTRSVLSRMGWAPSGVARSESAPTLADPAHATTPAPGTRFPNCQPSSRRRSNRSTHSPPSPVFSPQSFLSGSPSPRCGAGPGPRRLPVFPDPLQVLLAKLPERGHHRAAADPARCASSRKGSRTRRTHRRSACGFSGGT